MTTLEDARDWYEATLASLRLVERLAEDHWDRLPWDGPLGRDYVLRQLTAADALTPARVGQQPLDDLAVLVLFSVFESVVREAVGEQVAAEAGGLRHPALAHAAEQALTAIDEGSFFRVLEPYKGRDPGLIEEVNQVRRYRNWVAHGRRGDPPGNPPIPIDPATAYRRLARCLRLIFDPVTGGGPMTPTPATPVGDVS